MLIAENADMIALLALSMKSDAAFPSRGSEKRCQTVAWVSVIATIIRYHTREVLEHLGPVAINVLGRWRGTVFSLASNPRKEHVGSFQVVESGASAMI